MKTRLIAVLLLLCAAGASAGELSLEGAVNLALERNNDIKSARQAESAARHALRSSYGAFMPRLAAEGSWTALNGPIDLDLNSVRSAIISADAATALVLGGSAGAVRTALEGALPDFTMRVQANPIITWPSPPPRRCTPAAAWPPPPARRRPRWPRPSATPPR